LQRAMPVPMSAPRSSGMMSMILRERFDRGSQRTPRWREVDSNPRSPVRVTPFSNPLINGSVRGFWTYDRGLARGTDSPVEGFEPSVPRLP
jgi:hypothetical protein